MEVTGGWWESCSGTMLGDMCQLAGPCYGPPRVSPENSYGTSAWTRRWIGHTLHPPYYFLFPTKYIFINTFHAKTTQWNKSSCCWLPWPFFPAKHNYAQIKIHHADSMLCQEATTNPGISLGSDQTLSGDEPGQTHSRSTTANLGLWAQMSCKAFESDTKTSSGIGKLGGF